MPLCKDAEVSGAITICRQEVSAFSAKEVALLENFAAQAVIAMENARLLSELRVRDEDNRRLIARQSASIEILKTISASPDDPQPVFDLIARYARALCGAAQVSVTEYDGALLHMRARDGWDGGAALNYAAQHWPQPAGANSLAGRAALSGRVERIRDLTQDAGYGGSAVEVARTLGTRSAMGVPLLRDGRAIGAIVLHRTEVGEFDEGDVALVESFAEQAVIAVTSATSRRELRASTVELAERNTAYAEQIDHQSATIDVLKAMSASPGDPQPVFDVIVRRAQALCGSTNAALWEHDGASVQCRAIVSSTWSTEELSSYRQAMPSHALDADTSVSRASVQRRVVHIRDASQEGGLSDSAVRLGLRSSAVVPIIFGDRSVGVLSMSDTRPGGFSDSQIALLETFAEQAAIAITAAETFRALEARTTELAARNSDFAERIDQQAATIDVLKVMSASPDDTQPVFDQIVRRAQELCGSTLAALFEYDGELVHWRSYSSGTLRSVAERAASGPDGAAYASLWPMSPSRKSIVCWAILDRQVIHIRDRDAVTGVFPATKTQYNRSLLIIPLQRDDMVLGAILLASAEVGGFTDSQVELLKTFAEQAVIAIGSVATYRALRTRTAELQQSLEYQAATIDVLKVMSSSTSDTQPVFDVILHHAMTLSGAVFGALFEYDGALVHMRATIGYESERLAGMRGHFPRRPSRATVAERALLDRQVVYVRDYAADPELWDLAQSMGFGSVVAVPLSRDAATIGTITWASGRIDGFTPTQIDLLKTFAEQAVIAIGTTATFRALQDRTAELTRSVAELQALEEMLRAVNSSLDLETVLATIIDRAVPLAQADEGLIYEFSEAEQVFVPKAAFGMTEDRVSALRERRIRIGETYLGRSAAERVPVSVDDVQTDGGTPEARTLLQGIHAVLAVPLLRDNVVVGGPVIRRRTQGAFAPATIALMQTFAAQSVLAIENARLFEAARRAHVASDAALADLRRTQDRLVQTEKLASLGQLTAGIAHEIKNPLNFVNNFSDLSVGLVDELHEAVAPDKLAMADELRAEIDDITATLKGNLEKIVHHGRRADSIVRNMLQHSRTGVSELREVDFNATVEEAVNLAYHGARAEQPGFNITLERDFDPAAGTVALYPQEFTRVLLNLCSNGFYAANKRASEAVEPGYAPTLRISTRNLGDKVEVRVRDNGTGIPADARERLFQPFFTTKPTGEGTGLGLSMSHDIIVKQHGGNITVESVPGAFAEFEVTLPHRPSEAAE